MKSDIGNVAINRQEVNWEIECIGCELGLLDEIINDNKKIHFSTPAAADILKGWRIAT